MIRVFLLLLASIAGSWYVADSLKQKGAGYVFILYNNYSVETSLWFAIFLFVVFFLGLYFLVKTFRFVIDILKKLGYLPTLYGISRAKKFKYKGSLAYLNQQWNEASKYMAKAGKKSDSPFLDYMMAARAGLLDGDTEHAEKYRLLAQDCPDKDDASLLLLSLDIAIAKKDAHLEMQLVAILMKEFNDKSAVLLRAIAVFSAQGKWSVVHGLLPKIKKYKVLNEQRYEMLLCDVAKGLLSDIRHRSQLPQLKSIWKEFSAVQSSPTVFCSYCGVLMALGEHQEAQRLLEQALLKRWNNEYIRLYGLINSQYPLEQLEFAEKLLLSQPDNAHLFLTLGRLALMNKLFGKAKDYLDKSIKISPSIPAYQLMANLCDEQSDFVRGKAYLQQALALV